ncbi:MAG: hypothetical protein JNL58_05390 [Planctomyces sp.]|nr:hypothetical protein [Planctomyces sp.]
MDAEDSIELSHNEQGGEYRPYAPPVSVDEEFNASLKRKLAAILVGCVVFFSSFFVLAAFAFGLVILMQGESGALPVNLRDLQWDAAWKELVFYALPGVVVLFSLLLAVFSARKIVWVSEKERLHRQRVQQLSRAVDECRLQATNGE